MTKIKLNWTYAKGELDTYGYDICKADNGTHITDGIFKGPNDGGQWDTTYEEALEVGIQEALKLI